MLDDGLHAQSQINKFLELQSDLPLPFLTNNDCGRLIQIDEVLLKFNEVTNFISNPQSVLQFRFATSCWTYLTMHQSAEEISGQIWDKEEKKHYKFMDESDTYYTALILDPRLKI
ncbi:hypothetical protein V1515DRAFT_579897 [Lipomyces mesembrius]